MKNFYTFTKKTSSLIISIIFLLIISANYSTAQVTVDIGTGTSITTGTGETPFGTYYHDGQNQILILASELTSAGLGAGNITSIGWNVASAQSQTMNGFNIEMKHTTATSTTSFETGFTNCYSGTHVATAGWNMFTLSTSFNWNGTSNLLIKVCFDNTSYTSNSSVYYTSTGSTMNAYAYTDGGTGCSLGYTTSSTQRPNTRITGASSGTLPNDDCSSATTIGIVTDQAFSTTLATVSGETSCMTSPDIWYVYTASGDGTLDVDLCGSLYDTKLAVFDACGGTLLACNDDNGPACTGLQSSISLSVNAGSYYIQVGGYSSNVGDGDITVNFTVCNASFPYTESFESGFGTWMQWTGDNFDWTRLSGTTGSSGTGPSSAYDGSYYIYTESSSPNYPSLTAGIYNRFCFATGGLTSPEIEFAYHMYGAAMGTLTLQVSTDGGSNWNDEWSLSGDQGNAWFTTTVSLSGYGNTDNVLIRWWGLTSTSYTSDMAVDDISIYQGGPPPPTGLWVGTTSTDWATGSNWDDGQVPIASTDVTIPGTATNWPTFSGDFELGSDCNSIILDGTSFFTVLGDITIPSGYTITCNSTATIILDGDWNKYGDFIAGTGTVEFNGNTNSILSGTPLKSNNVNTLELSKYQPDFVYENSFNDAEYDINAKPHNVPPSDVAWDLQFSYDVDTPSGLTGIAGSETDGTYLYGTKWSGTGEIVKFDLAGNFIETFTIPGVVDLRDLAYDGQYFYGSNAGSYIYEMDFVSKTLISTITTPASVRAIAYDSDLDGFWYNNFATDLHFVDRSGTLLNTITAPPSMYGCAYDNLSSGGPYLWIFTGTTTGAGCQVEQYHLSTKTLTGYSHSVSGDLGDYIAGGLWIQPNLVTGTYSIGGMAQGTPDLVFGYELGSSPDFYNLVSNKTNAEVLLDCDVQVNNNLTIMENSYATNSTGTTLTISNGKLVVESDAVGSGSFIDNGTVVLNSGAETNVERYTITDRWHMFSPSVSGETADIFHFGASTGYDVYLMEHDEATDSYSYIWDETTVLNPLQGYFVWGDGAHATPVVNEWTYQMNGGLNTGSFGSTDNLTRSFAGDGSGWNLVGNPYPSVIDWDALSGWTKTNIDATIYVYTGSQWATYTNGGSGTNGGSRYIALGQAIFVNVSAVGTGTLMMDNDVRVHNGVGYLKSEIDNELSLQVEGNNFTDETVIVFNEEATLGFDSQFDAYKLESLEENVPTFYSVANENLAVNVLPAVDWVQLGFHAGVNGEYTISATDISDIPTVLLEDTFTGEFTDLTSGSYTFVYSTNDNPKRFIVHFSALSTPENVSGLTNIYSYNKDVYVSVPEDTKGQIMVYDMIGQEVVEAPITSSLNVIRLEKGAYYIVKVQSEENVVTKKVLIR